MRVFYFSDPNVKQPRAANRMRSRANRRNTMDCALLNEMFIDDDSKFSDKRSKQLLRESERDNKRSSMALVGPVLSAIESMPNTQIFIEERADSLPATNRLSGNNLLEPGTKLVKKNYGFCIKINI